MKRSPLNPVSDKRRAANREYNKRSKLFLFLHPFCQAYIRIHGLNENDVKNRAGRTHIGVAPRSVEIHHMKKPKSTYLNDETTWLAVSRDGHNWIENHKDEARALGLLQDNH